MMGVNSIWFLRRWAGPLQWMQFLVFDVLTLPFAWVLGLFRGRGKAVLAKGLGIFDGLRGRRIGLKTDNNRLLLFTNMEAGHGGASGRFEIYKEVALEYAFILDLEGINQ